MGSFWAHMGAIGCIVLTHYTLTFYMYLSLTEVMTYMYIVYKH